VAAVKEKSSDVRTVGSTCTKMLLQWRTIGRQHAQQGGQLAPTRAARGIPSSRPHSAVQSIGRSTVGAHDKHQRGAPARGGFGPSPRLRHGSARDMAGAAEPRFGALGTGSEAVSSAVRGGCAAARQRRRPTPWAEKGAAQGAGQCCRQGGPGEKKAAARKGRCRRRGARGARCASRAATPRQGCPTGASAQRQGMCSRGLAQQWHHHVCSREGGSSGRRRGAKTSARGVPMSFSRECALALPASQRTQF
jgi:hypothetical protein